MARRFDYDDRPESQYTPLRADEVEALILNGGQVLNQQPGRLVHFLHRVAATLRDQAGRVARLQADVDAIRIDREAAAHPMARAVEALAQLDDEQKRALLDEGYLRELARLEDARREAELVRLGAENESNRIRHALAGVLEDPTVSPEVKQHVRLLLGRIGYRY